MIKNMLKRRKESDTYLATDSRHRRSLQIAMKVDKVCSFQLALRPSSAEEEDSVSFTEVFLFSVIVASFDSPISETIYSLNVKG